MACNDCFNGCVQTTSDQCVKYTGNDIAAWGIEKGDPLSEVISKLKTYLDDIASGDNILPDIDTPSCADISVGTGTLNDILDSIIDVVCAIQAVIDDIEAASFTDTNCLTGSPSPTDFLAVIQAIIDKICLINTNITDIEDDVDALENGMSQYVETADVGTYVATYLNGLPEAGKYYTRMVPYVVEKYYGPTNSAFSLAGAGLGAFQYIYVCNGNAGTPNLTSEFTTDYIYIMHVPPNGIVAGGA